MLKVLLTPIAAASLLLGAGFASASPEEWFNIEPDPGSYSAVTVNYLSTVKDFSSNPLGAPLIPASGASQGAARFRIDVLPTNLGNLTPSSSFYTYCVELSQYMSGAALGSSVGLDYHVLSQTNQIGTSQISALERLWTNGATWANANATNGAAFQAAVWEVVYEKTGTLYDLSSGDIWFGGNVAALAQANTYLNTTVAPSVTVGILHSDHGQDYMVMTPVPEPEGYALAFAGLAMVGVFSRKFRAAKKA